MVRIDDTALDEIEKDSRQCVPPGMGDVQLMVAEIRRLKADNERLKSENDEPEWHLMMAALEDRNVKLNSENERLRQENEKLRDGRAIHLKEFYKFPERLLKKRIECGFSQRQLSSMTGISCPAISNYETGKIRPGMKNILRLEKALDCPGAFQGVDHD